MAKYKVTQSAVSALLEDVRNDKIAIPELQRPFVWDSVKVRDLMDSLYKGYPVGYLITWQSVGAHLKGGGAAGFQQILIDGQQRVTALRAAVAGLPVVDQRYRKKRITIAFNPVTEEFATLTPVLAKDDQWISDISEVFNATAVYKHLSAYIRANPDADEERIEASFDRLMSIKNAQIGVISLNDDLDVETVTEIFIRINSKGVPLSSADFTMSKIATYGERGRNLRKLIDYFCNLAVAPHVYDDIEANDEEFAATPYLGKIAWLRHDAEDLYDPQYGDVIRVAGLVGFSRGKASSIVSLLSGRDPETRTVDEARIPVAYDRLEDALLRIVNRYHFENFLLTIKSAGFVSPKMIGSRNALNFAYALYLRLAADQAMSDGERKRIVRRFFVLSLLTGRSSGSFETKWELDIRRIAEVGAAEYLAQLEASELSDGFWRFALPANLETTSVGSPYFQSFVAAQISGRARGFLSRSVTVAAMHEQVGDVHHIVPKDYLRKNGFPDRRDYNQVANFAITETPVNISISNRPPAEYLSMVREQIADGRLRIGEISAEDDLVRNLAENAVPDWVDTVTVDTYRRFLGERRQLMAERIRRYYESL